MMKFLAFMCFVVCATVARAEPSLIGQWKSNAALSMQFNHERAKFEQKTELFLSQILGNLTITFTKNTVGLEMPNIETQTAEGKKNQLVGFSETHTYNLLGATENSLAIKSIESVTGNESITVYNFEGNNTMWVYSGTSHLREYFVRIVNSREQR